MFNRGGIPAGGLFADPYLPTTSLTGPFMPTHTQPGIALAPFKNNDDKVESAEASPKK